MTLLNTSQVLGLVFYNLNEYVFGADWLTSFWILLVILMIAGLFNIVFSMALLLFIPVTIVLMAYGWMPPAMGAIVFLLVGLVLAWSWWQNR